MPFTPVKSQGSFTPVNSPRIPIPQADSDGTYTNKVLDITKNEFQKASEKASEARESFSEGGVGGITRGLQKTFQAGVGAVTAPIQGLVEPIVSPAFEKGAEKFGDILESGLKRSLGEEKGRQAFDDMKKEVGEDIEYLTESYENLPENYKTIVDTGLAGLEAYGVAEGSMGLKSLIKGLTKQTKNLAEKVPELAQTAKKSFKEYTERNLRNHELAVLNNAQRIERQKLMGLKSKIETEVDTFLDSKKALTNALNKNKFKGKAIRNNLKNPEIFAGLNVMNGKLDPSEAIENIQIIVDKAMDAKTRLIPYADQMAGKVPKESFRNLAYKMIDDISPADVMKIQKKIDDQIEFLPDELYASDLDRIRRQFRRSSRTAQDILKEKSHYSALELAARDLMFEQIDKIPIGTEGAMANLSQTITDLIATQKFLDKNARGMIVSRGRMSKLLTQTIGAVAGSKLGPVGAIGGAEIGGIISDILANNKLANSIKKSLLSDLMGGGDDAIKTANRMVDEIAEQQLRRPRQLVSPIEGAPSSQINQPITLREFLPDESPAKIIGTTESTPNQSMQKRLSGLIKKSDIDFNYDKPKAKEILQAESEVLEEMVNSVKGERIFSEEGVTGLKSTFPKWVSENLRSKKLFDSVIDKLISGKELKGKAKNLYNEMIEEAQKKIKKYGGEISEAIIEQRIDTNPPF